MHRAQRQERERRVRGRTSEERWPSRAEQSTRTDCRSGRLGSSRTSWCRPTGLRLRRGKWDTDASKFTVDARPLARDRHSWAIRLQLPSCFPSCPPLIRRCIDWISTDFGAISSASRTARCNIDVQPCTAAYDFRPQIPHTEQYQECLPVISRSLKGVGLMFRQNRLTSAARRGMSSGC